MNDFALLDTEQEELDRLTFEIENSQLPARRHAVELLLLRKLLAVCRSIDSRHRPHKISALLERLPRISDKEAWDRLAAEQRAELELTPPN